MHNGYKSTTHIQTWRASGHTVQAFLVKHSDVYLADKFISFDHNNRLRFSRRLFALAWLTASPVARMAPQFLEVVPSQIYFRDVLLGKV